MDVVGISSTKRRDSNAVEQDDEWKHFSPAFSHVTFAQVGLGILVRPLLASCVDEWIPLGQRACMLTVVVDVIRPLPAFDTRLHPNLKSIVPRGITRGLCQVEKT